MHLLPEALFLKKGVYLRFRNGGKAGREIATATSGGGLEAAKMGAHLARRYLWDAEVEPDPIKMPTFDPHFGFPEERKERVMIATEQQMNEAQLPLDMRDYCAHYFLKLAKCKRDKFPNIFGCKHERHDWDYCEHLDYVMRMKEFERERRLLARKKRIEQKAKAAAAAS